MFKKISQHVRRNKETYNAIGVGVALGSVGGAIWVLGGMWGYEAGKRAAFQWVLERANEAAKAASDLA